MPPRRKKTGNIGEEIVDSNAQSTTSGNSGKVSKKKTQSISKLDREQDEDGQDTLNNTSPLKQKRQQQQKPRKDLRDNFASNEANDKENRADGEEEREDLNEDIEEKEEELKDVTSSSASRKKGQPKPSKPRVPRKQRDSKQWAILDDTGTQVGDCSCACCRATRSKCLPYCPLAPYFPPDHITQWEKCANFYGAIIHRLVRQMPVEYRSDLVGSLRYESEARDQDSTYGTISTLARLYVCCQNAFNDRDRQIQEFNNLRNYLAAEEGEELVGKFLVAPPKAGENPFY